MNISTKGRYAVRAMLDLALQSSDGPTLIKDISKRQEISDLYLEQLFNRLKTAGLLRSVRGPKGGFMLTRPPVEIRLIDIFEAMEGPIAPVDCVDNATLCTRADSCVTRDVWAEMKKAMVRVLESTTLQDLVKRENGKGSSEDKKKQRRKRLIKT
jgi:Rrf2 family cysteine metabolism transcriptional repressor